MDQFREEIIKAIKKEVKDAEIILEIPPNPELGDYAFPCFSLAKFYKKNPADIAKELASKIKKSKFISEIKVIGPYLNFFINKDSLTGGTLKEILRKKDKFGSSNTGKNKKIILEHTSINPNASPHVGRARNAFIGDALARVLRFQKYNVEVHYYVNDIGKQIAMLVLAAKNKKNIQFGDLLKMYMGIAAKVEKSKELEKEVLGLLYKLENGDKKIISEFKKIVNISIKGQIKLLSELGIEYDVFDYESSYLWSRKTHEALKLLEKSGRFFLTRTTGLFWMRKALSSE